MCALKLGRGEISVKMPVQLVSLVIAIVLPGLCKASANETIVPEPFARYDASSARTVNYDGLSDLLRTVVVEVAESDRNFANAASDITGTRMKSRVNRATSNEGNRFLYEAFRDNDAARQFLRDIQSGLEELPSRIPLESFSRDEQLAYWLNLYNVTVLNEIINIYPRKNLKGLSTGRNSIFSRKLLKVADISLSLDDIQFTILKQNYGSNPLVIYGLYQGVIGGPDIRPAAYTGDTVWNALEENAYNFVNSNRGTLYRDEKSPFRVSAFYDKSSVYFPDFQSDLEAHLLQHLEGKERQALQTVDRVRPDIIDWTVTDLVGTRKRIGGSLATNEAAMLDAYRRPDGRVMVEPAIVKAPKSKEDEEPEKAPIENRREMPVDGATMEEIAPDSRQGDD